MNKTNNFFLLKRSYFTSDLLNHTGNKNNLPVIIFYRQFNKN